ncbi:hypothetical protein Bbelb_288570 [Branchiostoma belcheri]|nr:hypothetical protein Bbelb_288570 [Branchiostoma belcheri]
MYKIIHGLVQCPTIKIKLTPPPPSRQRRTHSLHRGINVRTQYRAGASLHRTIKEWNTLSESAVEATTVDTLCPGLMFNTDMNVGIERKKRKKNAMWFKGDTMAD